MGVRPLQEGPLVIAYVAGLMIAGGTLGFLASARAVNLLVTHKIFPNIHKWRVELAAVGLIPGVILVLFKPIVGALIILGIYLIPKKSSYTSEEFKEALDREVNASMFPKGLKIEGTLNMKIKGWVEPLPEGLEVSEDLVIEGFYRPSMLKNINKGEGIIDTLAYTLAAAIVWCSSHLEFLPKGLKVGGSLNLTAFPKEGSLPEDLSVGKNIVLKYCNSSEPLPQSLKLINGDLEIDRSEVQLLPDDLEVKGNLILKNCKRLSSLPKGLKIGGNLQIDACESLTSIPDDLQIAGEVSINKCISLKSLPKGFKVSGDLELQGVESLPDDLEVSGKLTIYKSPGLKSLPKGLKAGSLKVFNCPNLETLTADLQVKKTIILFECGNLKSLPNKINGDLTIAGSGITSLPEDFEVSGRLELIKCSELESLPNGLKVGSLALGYCPKLESLTQGIKIESNLIIEGCEWFSLPENLELKGNLIISKCSNFEILPRGLKVKGSISVMECERFTSLQGDLEVEGDLAIRYCPLFRALPQTPLRLGGHLDLHGCRNVTALPDWVVELGVQSTGEQRDIRLTATGVIRAEVDRLKALPRRVTGLTFIISLSAINRTHTFQTLEGALQFWLEQANFPALVLPEISIDQQNLVDVLTFLEGLTGTAEFKKDATRPILAERVIRVFTVMSQDKAILDISLECIHNGVETCHDNVIDALDNIEVKVEEYKIEQSDLSEEELKKQAKRFWALDQVWKKAHAFIEDHPADEIDPIEEHLAFKIGLADRFNLPISTRNKNYGAQASRETIAAAGNQIENSWTEEVMKAYLETWAPWVQYQRKKALPKYEDLREERPLQPDEICCILLVTPAEPVLYNNLVYSYEAFKRIFIKEGQDPVSRQKIDLKELTRLTPIL